jgi:hypothetical protein
MLAVVSIEQIYLAIFSKHFHTSMMIHPLTDVVMLLGKIIPIETLNSDQTLIIRYLELSAFKCVASSEPSSDLVILLRSFNPDLFFTQAVDDKPEELISMVLNWLKVCPVTQFANTIII